MFAIWKGWIYNLSKKSTTVNYAYEAIIREMSAINFGSIADAILVDALSLYEPQELAEIDFQLTLLSFRFRVVGNTKVLPWEVIFSALR